MSDYQKKGWCKTCQQITEHHYMDNVPRHHEYTIKCTVCGRETLYDNFHHLADDVLDLRKRNEVPSNP